MKVILQLSIFDIELRLAAHCRALEIMKNLIEPEFELEIYGKQYLGRGPKASGKGTGWSSNSNIFYRCAECGDLMNASYDDYWNCKCGAVHLDIDAGRFGSRYGDMNILVYKSKKTLYNNG